MAICNKFYTNWFHVLTKAGNHEFKWLGHTDISQHFIVFVKNGHTF
jgi:hypothetical protein